MRWHAGLALGESLARSRTRRDARRPPFPGGFLWYGASGTELTTRYCPQAPRSIEVRDFGDTGQLPAAAVLARWQVMPSAAGRDPPARRQTCLHDSPRRTLARSLSFSLCHSTATSVDSLPRSRLLRHASVYGIRRFPRTCTQ